MGAFSTLTLRHTLMDRLDTQLSAASDRAATRRAGIQKDADATDATKPTSAATSIPSAGPSPAAGDQQPPSGAQQTPSGTSQTPPPGAVAPGDGDKDDPGVPAGLDAAGQSTGTLTLIAPGDSSDGTSTVTAGYIDDSGQYRSLSTAECEALLSLEPSGEPVTVAIDSLGDYRVLVTKDSTTGDVVVTGLSLADDNALVRKQLIIEAAIAVVGALLAAVAGRLIVRSSLAPLERVAATAERVASQPLARGEVSIEERVEDEDLASSQEVGQVGGALNTLLGHVEEALSARQRSETQVRQFVADASHELRTPLASIRGYTELIQREGADAQLPEEATHALERVHSESLRMTALVEDLLLLARLDAGRELHHEEVDLVGLLLDTVSDARAAGPEQEWDLDLAVLEDGAATDDGTADGDEDVEPEPPLVIGDEARLRQVVVNLLANARVHTPTGTHVTTTLSREQGADGDRLVIRIADDGPGIDPAVRDRLFERFARGDSSRERRTGSTGLGMSIALAIVRSHGGTLTVDSVREGDGAPGEHGTTFTVSLPAAALD
ncbi:sensor histidine kinase [Actinomyces radicidentis]|nr:HAMP domain-containing sensor histidine kinase [Actinomyces radicidentis]